MSAGIDLVVGLGNPGSKYEATRHNVGFWFVDAIARSKGAGWRNESKFHGECCKVVLEGRDVWLLKPMTFMNRSGQAVAALAQFYKLTPDRILVVHDELDIAAGVLRLKVGGGHGGHNGLRDIIAQMGSNEFVRLRVGIGHPGNGNDVTNYVLGRPGQDEQIVIERALEDALVTIPQIITGQLQHVMQHLHSRALP